MCNLVAFLWLNVIGALLVMIIATVIQAMIGKGTDKEIPVNL
jgi:hypothetical protein